ncbi:MAG TPA: hypothetical protein VNV44_13605 [Solirubrobacteraceae bacterium]|nr:hypothetical protein [Solirubrobacteraceae bacterium]
MSHDAAALDQILAREVFIAGASRAFGTVTLEHARMRADELRELAGWGPTMRVLPVAHAWRELVLTMECKRAGTVAELGDELDSELLVRLAIVMPSAPMAR